jgi:hypothetical protein
LRRWHEQQEVEAMSVQPMPSGDVQRELEDLVASIRRSGPGVVLSEPSQEAIRRFVEHVANEPVMSAAELAEWTAKWEAVEKEMRDRDRADDIAEGRAWKE